jgi:hypothetical protein
MASLTVSRSMTSTMGNSFAFGLYCLAPSIGRARPSA